MDLMFYLFRTIQGVLLPPENLLPPGPWTGAVAFVRVTVKASPFAASAEGSANAVRPPADMLIGCAPAWAMLTCFPFSTAEPLVKLTVPKLSKGRITR